MSIIIKHNSGRYGNQLFSYFIGRILSDELKFKLYGNNIYDISYDYNQDGYMTYDNPIQIINDDNFKSLNDFNSIISDTVSISTPPLCCVQEKSNSVCFLGSTFFPSSEI